MHFISSHSANLRPSEKFLIYLLYLHFTPVGGNCKTKQFHSHETMAEQTIVLLDIRW